MPLRLDPPAGARPPGAAPRRAVFVAEGRGLRTLLPLIEALLAAEPEARVSLLVGGRDAASLPELPALGRFAIAFPNFRVDYILQDLHGGPAGAREGRLSGTALRQHLFGESPLGREHYVAGPEPICVELAETLANLSVPAERVFVHEVATTRPDARSEVRPAGPPAAATTTNDVRAIARHPVAASVILADGREASFVIEPDQLILHAGRTAGIDLPFSCTIGGCGKCRLHLLAGDVVTLSTAALRRHEREAGDILACSSKASAGPIRLALVSRRAAPAGDAER